MSKIPQNNVDSPISSKKKKFGSTSYHSSMDGVLYIRGVGHVVPDSFSGYGSLLDTQIDDDSEATSAFYNDSMNEVVPDTFVDQGPSIVGEADRSVETGVDAVVDEVHASPDLSPKATRFEIWCTKSIERQRIKDEERAAAAAAKIRHVDGGEADDFSESTKRFFKFIDNFAKKRLRK